MIGIFWLTSIAVILFDEWDNHELMVCEVVNLEPGFGEIPNFRDPLFIIFQLIYNVAYPVGFSGSF